MYFTYKDTEVEQRYLTNPRDRQLFDSRRISGDELRHYDIESTNQLPKGSLINDILGEQVCQVTYNGLCQSQILVRGVLVEKAAEKIVRIRRGEDDDGKSARIIGFIYAVPTLNGFAE